MHTHPDPHGPAEASNAAPPGGGVRAALKRQIRSAHQALAAAGTALRALSPASLALHDGRWRWPATCAAGAVALVLLSEVLPALDPVLPWLGGMVIGVGLHQGLGKLKRLGQRQTPFPTELVSQDISTLQQALGVLTQQVNATIQTSETAVLSMAERLDRVHAATTRMHERMQSAVQHSERLSTDTAASADRQASALAELSHQQQRIDVERRELMARVRGAADQVRNLAPLATLISDIARKTNLLAVNAAIEAAHAGPGGAGFKVVAGEVRRLSVQAADAASQVGAGIQAAVQAITAESALLEARLSVGSSGQLEDVAGQVQGLVSALRDVVPYLSSLSSEVDLEVEAVTADVMDTLGDMQFQDINRQLLEQINHALGGLSTHFAQLYQLIDGQAPPPPVQLEELLQAWTRDYVMHAQRVAHAIAGASTGTRGRGAQVIPLHEPAPLELAVVNGPRIQLF